MRLKLSKLSCNQIIAKLGLVIRLDRTKPKLLQKLKSKSYQRKFYLVVHWRGRLHLQRFQLRDLQPILNCKY